MKKFVDQLQKLQLIVGTVFLTIFLITVVFQVFSRRAGITAPWTEEIAMYSFIWAVFMGSGAMVYEKRHFAFTSVSDALKNEKIKRILSIVISVIMLVFAVLMIKYGYETTKQFWNYKWVNITALKRGPTWLCLPLCGLTSSIYLVYLIIDDMKHILKGDFK